MGWRRRPRSRGRRGPSARCLWLWGSLSEFEGFEEIIEVRFVLVHSVAIL